MTPTTGSDLPRTTHAMPTITIYDPRECPNCDATMKLFDRRGIAYSKIDLGPGDANHRHVTDKLGYQQAPVIVVDFQSHRTVHWGGHRMDMLTALTRLCANGVVPEDEGASR
ncbi:glutaredoxin family protein [Streptomyces sp. NPDC002671]